MAKSDIVGFSLDAAKKIAKAVREVDRLVQYRPRHQARFPVPTETPVIVAKITGGTNPYSAVEVVPGEDGTWTTKTDGIEWSASGDNPLYERNDNARVPANTYVRVWKAFVADDLSAREWVFDASSSVPQSGTGVPSYTAPAGSTFYSTDLFTLYINYNGSTGWTTTYGAAYDYLGRLVYARQALTSGTTLTANHRVQHTLGGSGYTTGLPAVSGLDTEHYAFYVLPSATGIYTIDGNSNEELQGPRGSGAAVNRTRKYVKNEHVWIEGDGSNWRILAETMLEVGFDATQSAPQTIGTGSATKVQFDTLNWDINSGYDNVTNFRFLPLAPGIYSLKTGVPLESMSDGKRLKLMVYKNGSPYRTLASITAGAAGNLMVSGAVEMSMNGSTDYAEVFVEHDEGGDLDTVSSGGDVAWFQASRIRRDES